MDHRTETQYRAGYFAGDAAGERRDRSPGLQGGPSGEGVLEAYDPAVVWDFRSSPFRDFLKENVYLGHEGIRRFIQERYDDAWAEVEDHLDELIDAGEQVISVVTSRGRGLASGVEVEREHAGLWTIRTGRIVRVAWFGTRAEALAAAGLSE